MAKNFYKYQVDFKIKNQSLYSQENFYHKLLSILTQEEKDNLEICVTDPLFGKHYLFDGYGIAPTGEKCKDCINFTCEKCKKANRLMELSNHKKIEE